MSPWTTLVTHSAVPRLPLFVLTTFFHHLWSITEQTHGNTKSICQEYFELWSEINPFSELITWMITIMCQLCLLVSFWLSVFRLLLSSPSQRTRSFVAFDHSISFKLFFFSMATEDINWNSFHYLFFIDLWVSFQSSGAIRSKLILNVNF